MKKQYSIPSLGARPSIKDPRNVQFKNLKTLAAIPDLKGGVDYTPSDIEHQHKVGICTAISVVQAAEKFYGKKFSPDFHYLMQKKFIDKNWGEGSSLLNSLKSAKRFGFLPIEEFEKHCTEQDRLLPYDEYITKLWDIPQKELDRLSTLSKNYPIQGYADVPITTTDIANAIARSPVGILVRYAVGSEWWTALDGRVSWAAKDINPLRAPTPKTFVSGHGIIMSKYDFSKLNWVTLANTWGKNWNKKGLGNALLGYYSPTEAWLPIFAAKKETEEELKAELQKKISLLQKIVLLYRKVVELTGQIKNS